MHGGEAVLVGDRAVGVTTSGGYGHTTGKSLGFAYVEPELAAPKMCRLIPVYYCQIKT